MDISSISPLTFTTLDGVERKFHLTMRQQRDIAKRYGSQLMELPIAAALPGILYECLMDKAEITEDQFADVLPPDEELLAAFYVALREQFSGKQEGNEKYRPTKKTPANESSVSSGSGGQTSVN